MRVIELAMKLAVKIFEVTILLLLMVVGLIFEPIWRAWHGWKHCCRNKKPEKTPPNPFIGIIQGLDSRWT